MISRNYKKKYLSEDHCALVSRALRDSEWANLTEREQRYIELRYDANGNRKASLLEVAQQLWRIGTHKKTLGSAIGQGISTQRVLQIDEKVFRKLRQRVIPND